MRLVDPTVPAKEGLSVRAPALESLEGRTIGLLWNHKLNGDRLLTETARRLQARFGGKVPAHGHQEQRVGTGTGGVADQSLAGVRLPHHGCR